MIMITIVYINVITKFVIFYQYYNYFKTEYYQTVDLFSSVRFDSSIANATTEKLVTGNDIVSFSHSCTSVVGLVLHTDRVVACREWSTHRIKS